jgi:hypothetical protein
MAAAWWRRPSPTGCMTCRFSPTGGSPPCAATNWRHMIRPLPNQPANQPANPPANPPPDSAEIPFHPTSPAHHGSTFLPMRRKILPHGEEDAPLLEKVPPRREEPPPDGENVAPHGERVPSAGGRSFCEGGERFSQGEAGFWREGRSLSRRGWSVSLGGPSSSMWNGACSPEARCRPAPRAARSKGRRSRLSLWIPSRHPWKVDSTTPSSR